MVRDPERLRCLAVVDAPSTHWHVFEPLLDTLAERGFDFGIPVEKKGAWWCQYGPFELTFSHRPPGWAVAMSVHEDNSTTRALLATLDAALRKTTGVTTVGWYKREAPGGPPASSPIEP